MHQLQAELAICQDTHRGFSWKMPQQREHSGTPMLGTLHMLSACFALAAQESARWREVCHLWYASKWYPDLNRVDLSERQFLVVGRSFHLLPMRHCPVEEHYETSLEVVPHTDADAALPGWVVATDGSPTNHQGWHAVIAQPPGTSDCLIGRGHIAAPCTNADCSPNSL